MLQANRRRFHRVMLLGLAGLWLLTVGMPGTEAAEPLFSNQSLREANLVNTSWTHVRN